MKKKIMSLVLCLAMAASAFPVSALAAGEQSEEITGKIKATLRFDYPQLVSNVSKKNISVTLYDEDGNSMGEIPFEGSVNGAISSNTTVTKKNTEGGVLTDESGEIGYFDVDISDLPLGNYRMEFEGDGYTPYKTPVIELDDFSQHIVIGTGDSTFSIGDVNKDGKVNTKDRNLMSAALDKNDAANLSVYDLNGDNKINIVDLAYVNHEIVSKGEAQIFNTSLIAQKSVQTDKIKEAVDVTGEVNNLFVEKNEVPVTISAKADSNLSIPIELNKPTEMEQIEIVTPDGNGAMTEGKANVLYEDENGEEHEEEIYFDASVPEGIHLLGEGETNTRSVVISLGKRVAVKKVTINVTKVEGQDGTPTYTVIQEVKFLQDIVPENPVMQSLCVKNVEASALNESVRLKWDEFPNISGYTVYYKMENETSEKELTVDTNSALITGLKNLKTYYFTVVPISEGWQGGRSETVSAIPQPNSRPLKPDMVTVTPMDQALSISWKETENATYYRVFYKKASEPDSAYTEIPDGKVTATKAVIGGLENKTVYHLYVIAGNNIGEGPKSDIAEGIPDKFEVKAPDIPTLHMIDRSNIESIEMGNKNNVLASEYPNNFDVWNVADGDYGTHWTARAYWESNQFTFTFKEPAEMNYMVYVPRLDGNYRKSLSRYSITVWDEDENRHDLVSNKGISINSTTTGYMILPFEKSKVKKLAVSVSQWEGSPTGVSLAEAVFYESDNLEAEVRGLFANDIYTELSPEAMADKTKTEEKIESLRAQANDANGYYVDKDVLLDELNLAEALLNGDSSSLGRVKTGVESRSTGADSSRYKQAGSALQPLGVVVYSTNYAERNNMEESKVTIYAHIPDGETVSVVPTQYFAEANAWQGAAIPLQNGRNIIDIPQMGTQTSERGGSLYIRYSGSKADEISLQIRQGAISIPTLELSDWYSLDETERKARIGDYVDELDTHVAGINNNNIGLRIANSTEISMPNVLLSVAAAPVLSAVKPTGSDKAAAVEKLYNNVLAWEEFMSVANRTQGIDNTLDKSDMESRQNIRYMRMFGKAFMYAAGSHVGIGYGSVSGTVSGRPVSMMSEGAKSNNLFGWGLAHEVGHNMDKLGKAEITNNIYSLMIQTYDGNTNVLPSRLEMSNKYAGIYKKVAEGRPGLSNDVFVQLGMYWQLHLAYDDGDNPLDFYNRLFKEWKKGGVSGDDGFALTASKIANKNLTEFFEKWGMRLSDSTKAALKSYPEETRKVQYLNDNSRRYRLSGGAAGSGTTKALAVLDSANEKQVNLTFSTTADKASVLGFEISRNGKTIAFVPAENAVSGTYTDIIGSANNQAFAYTVQTIDMLGNKIGAAADAGQVRVSYVKTIDHSSYTMTRNSDNSISVIMNKPTAASGIKVTNAPKTGEYTVSVKRGDEAEFTTAKNGSFEKNESADETLYVAYFNKPKASSDDTRIWTYDAKEIKITGIPENAAVEFISYAGDNIEFTSDAAVGRLRDDYVYENGEGGTDVIKAGTLVVTGTYRGDPLYNTVQINGRFVDTDSETNEQTVTERAIDGYSLLFAEIPEDGEVSDISDGIFIFVPNVQKEAELQGEVHDCSAANLLPAQIKAELYRTDTAESTESKRMTSDTVWIESPSDDSMPVIILE